MDALSRMIARLQTQRACLDHAARLVQALPGDVLEVGLGKGRTYDRLRSLFPQRTIYAFDRELHCPQRLRPGDAELFLGDFRESLPAAFARLGRSAALAHVDLGTDDLARDRALAAAVAPLLDRLLLPLSCCATGRWTGRAGRACRTAPRMRRFPTISIGPARPGAARAAHSRRLRAAVACA
jgi:hypothetical protein